MVGEGADDLASARHIGARFLLADSGYGIATVLAIEPGVERARSFADVPGKVATLLLLPQ